MKRFEYALPNHSNASFSGENQAKKGWLNIGHRWSSVQITLNHEINYLRRQMEQLVLQEDSLSSHTVVQISSQLDDKIIQFMRGAKS